MYCHILSIMTPKKKNKPKASSYFEDFFVVGVDQASLEDINQDVCRLMPKNLFKYPAFEGGGEHSERTRVVKDFCFPGGVLIKKLNYNSSVLN
jgi:hypothetical protein